MNELNRRIELEAKIKGATALPWEFGGEDNELEGYKIVSSGLNASEDGGYREYIATVYSPQNVAAILRAVNVRPQPTQPYTPDDVARLVEAAGDIVALIDAGVNSDAFRGVEREALSSSGDSALLRMRQSLAPFKVKS
jgi:hypothetical protein